MKEFFKVLILYLIPFITGAFGYYLFLGYNTFWDIPIIFVSIFAFVLILKKVEKKEEVKQK